jgi:hypothetical protein
MTAPPRFLLFSLPRSGSTTLWRILRCHPNVRCAFEPFNKDSVLGQKYAIGIEDEASLEVTLSKIWQDHDGIKHVWDYCGEWPFRVSLPSGN